MSQDINSGEIKAIVEDISKQWKLTPITSAAVECMLQAGGTREGVERQKDEILALNKTTEALYNTNMKQEIAKQGISGTCEWTLYTIPNSQNYELVIGPQEGQKTGTLEEAAWKEYNKQIVFVKIEEGTKLGPYGDIFTNMENLEKIFSLWKLDTSGTRDFSDMFLGCRSLKELDLSGFNTANATNMSFMFADCNSLTELDLSSFNTRYVDSMGHMFERCENLKKINLSTLKTENITDMSCLFRECSSLRELNLRNFDVSNVKYMYFMFESCTSLQDLYIDTWDAPSVKSTSMMFADCKSMYHVDLSCFNSAEIEEKEYMFDGSNIDKYQIEMFERNTSPDFSTQKTL